MQLARKYQSSFVASRFKHPKSQFQNRKKKGERKKRKRKWKMEKGCVLCDTKKISWWWDICGSSNGWQSWRGFEMWALNERLGKFFEIMFRTWAARLERIHHDFLVRVFRLYFIDSCPCLRVKRPCYWGCCSSNSFFQHNPKYVFLRNKWTSDARLNTNVHRYFPKRFSTE